MACVSGLEPMLFRHAYRNGLLAVDMTPEAYRFGMASSIVPVFFFLGSIPVAFLSSTLAVVCWFLTWPAEMLLDRRTPASAKEFF